MTRSRLTVEDFVELELVHEIHTSGRRAFRQCRRKWDWAFNKAYYPKRTAKPLEFGVAYHNAMEVYYDPKTWNDDPTKRIILAIKRFEDTVEKQRAVTREYAESGNFAGDFEQDYDDRLDLGRGMLNYYFKEIAPKADEGWTPVKVEIGFMVDIPHPETGETLWCFCAECRSKWNTYISDQDVDDTSFRGLPVVYAGRIDMLAEDNTHKGNYYIFDWKTAAAISPNYDFLITDDQIGSYCWALSRLGLNIRGFVYHESRKGYPQPPKMNKQRRLGCLFSVAKNQDTNYETYLATIVKHDPEAYAAGHYDEILTYLKNDGVIYFNREKIVKANIEYDEIEKHIGQEVLEMINPNLALYPSPSKQGCSWCAFKVPCMEMNVCGDYQTALNEGFEVREHYYIRKDDELTEGGENG